MVNGINDNRIEEIHDTPARFETKDKIHTLKHNNRDIKVKVAIHEPAYLMTTLLIKRAGAILSI
jgi:hypothetical protein